MFADAEPDITTTEVLCGKIAAVFDVVLSGTVKVSGTSDELWHFLGDGLDNNTTGGACCRACACVEFWDAAGKVSRDLAFDGCFELSSQCWIRCTPCCVGCLPLSEGGFACFGLLGEVCANTFGYEERLFWQAEPFASFSGEFRATFTVAGCCAGNFWDALADCGLRDDDRWLAVVDWTWRERSLP